MATDKQSAVTELRPGQKAPEPFRPAKFQPAWVDTKNERQFLAMMETIEQAAGVGRLGYLWDMAGRGKTDTSAKYAAPRRMPHIRMRDDWRGSYMGFLRKLCLELGYQEAALPHSRTRCVDKIIEALYKIPAKNRVVFLDEMDRFPRHLDLVRDLADLTGAAFILIGEEAMPDIMNANRRVWSRTLAAVRFEAVEPQAIVSYGWESAGLKIEPAAALLINQAAGGGDWRMIRNRTVKAVALANARKDLKITEDLARLILDEELQGGRR